VCLLGDREENKPKYVTSFPKKYSTVLEILAFTFIILN
jgi:hypothetical protein